MIIDPDEARRAILSLAGSTTARADQAQSMTDSELGERLLNGKWSTIEVHEAGRRLMRLSSAPTDAQA